MADQDQVRTAVNEIAVLFGSDPAKLAELDLDRSLKCSIPDLAVAYRGRLNAQGVSELTEVPVGAPADVTITVSSDDLVALTSKKLKVMPAYLTGRLKIDAPFTDILKLRKIL